MASLPITRDVLGPPSLILQAFFDLRGEEQKSIKDSARIATDPASSEEARRQAEAVIESLLVKARAKNGRFVSEDELFSPELKALRAHMIEKEKCFATKVNQMMAARQWTQADLAAQVGVSQPAISMILSSRCRPHPRTIGKIASALGVPVHELWPEDR
jgi:DNA-binding XRE family transcriptional regulator